MLNAGTMLSLLAILLHSHLTPLVLFLIPSSLAAYGPLPFFAGVQGECKKNVFSLPLLPLLWGILGERFTLSGVFHQDLIHIIFSKLMHMAMHTLFIYTLH